MFPFDLIHVIVALAIVGLILWAITQVPMDDAIRKIIRVVIIVFVCIWLLLGLASLLGSGGVLSFPTRH